MINTLKGIKVIGIYKIISPSGRVYIGQSVNIWKRWNVYFNINKKSIGIKIYRSLKKYGPENHQFEVIEKCCLSQLDQREVFHKRKFIKKYGWFKALFCKIKDGEGGHCSEETKQKISKKNKGRIHSPEHCNNISKTRMLKRGGAILQFDKQGNFIKEWNNTIEIMENLKINRNSINNCCIGISKTAKGYIWKYKNNTNLNFNLSLNKNSKSVLQFKNGKLIKEWNSNLEAAKFLGKHPSAIATCCRGEAKSAYGYIWKWKDEEK